MTYSKLQSLVGEPDIDKFLGVIPGLDLLSSTPQDPQHHGEGDVWTHTKMVVSELLKSWNGRSLEDQFILYYSALLHDLAKPSTTVVGLDKITSAGHSVRGAVDARIFLWRAGAPFAVREAVCRAIARHQEPFWVLTKPEPERLYRVWSVDQRLDLLTQVARADMLGRKCPDQQKLVEDLDLLTLMATEDNCLDTPYPFASPEVRMRYMEGSSVSPDHSLHSENPLRVILTCGLPASGKSTWIKKQGLPVVGHDETRASMRLKYGDNEGAVTQAVREQVRQHLRNRIPFIWNGTRLKKALRRKDVDFLRGYPEIEVEIQYFEAPERVLLDRNRTRDGTLTNNKIKDMLWTWEVPTPSEAHVVQYQVEGP